MIRRRTGSKLTDTLSTYTELFRTVRRTTGEGIAARRAGQPSRSGVGAGAGDDAGAVPRRARGGVARCGVSGKHRADASARSRRRGLGNAGVVMRSVLALIWPPRRLQLAFAASPSSEECPVGEEGVSLFRSRWSHSH